MITKNLVPVRNDSSPAPLPQSLLSQRSSSKLVIRRQSSKRAPRRRSTRRRTAAAAGTRNSPQLDNSSRSSSPNSAAHLAPTDVTGSLKTSPSSTSISSQGPASRALSTMSASPVRRKLAYHHPALKRTDSFSSLWSDAPEESDGEGDEEDQEDQLEVELGPEVEVEEEEYIYESDSDSDAERSRDRDRFGPLTTLPPRTDSISPALSESMTKRSLTPSPGPNTSPPRAGRRSIMLLDDLAGQLEAFKCDVKYAPTLRRPHGSRTASSSPPPPVPPIQHTSRPATPAARLSVEMSTSDLVDMDDGYASTEALPHIDKVETLPVVRPSPSPVPAKESTPVIPVAAPAAEKPTATATPSPVLIPVIVPAGKKTGANTPSSSSAVAVGPEPVQQRKQQEPKPVAKPAIASPAGPRPIGPPAGSPAGARPNPTTYRPSMTKASSIKGKPEKKGIKRFFRKIGKALMA
ncbi:hypothetical protein HKX48_004739 [Thoreauomyces humboldtii]|nr:hypothetical protein HKX48_004739 [Thoreauomyces humboldtii]